MLGIDANFVPKNYTMDMETEYLVSNAHGLKDGMTVLIGAAMYRQTIRPVEEMTSMELESALENSRWAMIESITFDDDLVSFFAIYGDGSRRHRMFLGTNLPWLVKKDPTLNENDAYNQKLRVVTELVRDAMEGAIARDRHSMEQRESRAEFVAAEILTRISGM